MKRIRLAPQGLETQQLRLVEPAIVSAALITLFVFYANGVAFLPFVDYTNGRTIRMAHPGKLVETIASALGVPKQTVVQHDRHLVARGYRRKGGRGRSAIRVTPEDAANLLIAVAATPVTGPVIKETVGTFEKYASLPAWMGHLQEPADWSELRVLSELPKGHSFSAALAALIRGYARGDFASVDSIWRKFPKAENSDPGFVGVTVTLEGPKPSATITIDGHRGWGPLLEADSAELSYHEEYPLTKMKLGELVKLHRERGENGDLVQMREFTDYTLKAIATLFSDEGETQKKV